MKQSFGNLTVIPGPKNGKYPFCNAIFIDDEVQAVIDPASDKAALERLAENEKIDVLINSHYHEDHFTYNYLFPDADFYVHADDAPCFHSIDKLLEAYGIADGPESDAWRAILINSFNYQERMPARHLQDGDILDFGKTRLQVIHTPGHTPGHCGFFCESENLLFLGDIDLTPFGPWYGDAVSDIAQTINSVHRLLEIPAKVFVTSHNMGVVTGDIRGLAKAYLEVIYEREEKIINFLSAPRTLEEIAEQWFIYKKPREPKEFFMFGERGMVKKHLDYLIQKGRAARSGDHYYLV